MYRLTSMSLTLYLAALAAAIFMSPGVAHGESTKLISNVSNALGCYEAAQRSTLVGLASNEDIATCDRAIRMESLSQTGLAKTYTNRGVLRKSMNRNGSALRDYYRARSIGGETAELSVNIGNVAFAERRYEKALRYYNKALAMDMQKSYIAYVNRGLVNERLGNYDAAMRDYQLALQENSSLGLAIERLQSLQLGSTLDGDDGAMLASVAAY